MRRKHWARPTRRGSGAIVAGVVTAVVGYLLASLPLVFCGVVLLALVVSALVSVSLVSPAITLARRFTPDRAVAGWSVVETMALTTERGSATVRVRETIGWRLMHPSEAVAATVRAGEYATVSFVHDDLPRGRHRVGPARVDLVESFGLAQRLVVVPGRTELVVVPDVVGVGQSSESRSHGEGARRRRDHSVAAAQDDPITREYRRGDPMRRVHWRATARQGELMVRQEEQHGLPSARIVLPVLASNWRDAHPALGTGSAVSDGFEWAVSSAASAALDFGMAGSQTRVVTLDGDTVALHDPASTPMFLELLADLALDDTVDERSPEASPREPLIAIVSSLTPPEIERLGQNRGPGVRGVAIVVHLDSDVLSPEDTAPDSPTVVAATLRNSGWLVVETDSRADRSELLATRGILGG